MVHVDGQQQLLGGFLAVNKLPLGDHAGIQNPVSVTHVWRFSLKLQAVLQTSYMLPLPEISIQNPAGETLPADPDTFQHSVTSQLMKDQMVIHDSYNR